MGIRQKKKKDKDLKVLSNTQRIPAKGFCCTGLEDAIEYGTLDITEFSFCPFCGKAINEKLKKPELKESTENKFEALPDKSEPKKKRPSYITTDPDGMEHHHF